MASLNPLPAIYDDCTRQLGDVLEGADAAAALMIASRTGDTSTIQSFLSDPTASKSALESPHRIYAVDPVMARPILNLYWALREASYNNHAEAVSTLLAFGQEHNVKLSNFLRDDALARTMIHVVVQRGFSGVFAALVAADRTVVSTGLGHGRFPLGCAVQRQQAEIVAICLENVVDPSPVLDSSNRSLGYRGSLLCMAADAKNGDPCIAESLLKHGVKPKGSGGLHRAAELGAIEIMELFVKYGADVDEVLGEDGVTFPRVDRALFGSWTPGHFAASTGKREALELLESMSASEDLRDRDGRTAWELLGLGKEG